ncbi:MAG TPA: serine/threonine-protein kinase, partial [Kofleriaceae bacterium]|nr:serine/threonine-protein kinase [Kofleriaceae bacterium]
AAHSQGIIHRDLKPHNIVILDEPPGRDLIKILDFGLAKSLSNETTSLVTQTDALLGTPMYMPPEQITGKPCDARGDLYSLGCILYQMVSGRAPFTGGENLNAVLAMHLHQSAPPLPDSTPPALATLIGRLLMKAPEDRPATAGIVHATITAIASGAPSSVEALPPRTETRRLPARVVVAVAAAIAVGSVVGIVLSRRHHQALVSPSDASALPEAHDAASHVPADATIADAAIDAHPPTDARPVHDARPHVSPLDARVPAITLVPDARQPPDAGLPDIDLIPSHH